VMAQISVQSYPLGIGGHLEGGGADVTGVFGGSLRGTRSEFEIFPPIPNQLERFLLTANGACYEKTLI